MRKLLCLFLVLSALFCAPLSISAAGIGAGRGIVRVRAPGVRVNVGQRSIGRGGLFSRGLFQRQRVNVNVGARVFNRAAVNVNVGHSFGFNRSFAVNSYSAAAFSYPVVQQVYAQQVYAQPVVVQQAPVVQQQVYAAPALASVYAAPVIQYAQVYAAPVLAVPAYDTGCSYGCGGVSVGGAV